MFFTLIKNYIKAWFDSIGWFKKILRIKHTFEVDNYLIIIDMYSSYSRRRYDKSSIVEYYNYKFNHEYSHWKTLMDSLIPIENKYKKNVKEFIETVILTDIDPYGLSTYINKIEIKTIADIRDEKINKLLTSK